MTVHPAGHLLHILRNKTFPSRYALYLLLAHDCVCPALKLVTERSTTSIAQVYELTCGRSGAVYIAEPPAGAPVAALLSAAASRALGSPVVLPLDSIFGRAPASLAAVHAALLLSSGEAYGFTSHLEPCNT